MIPNIYESPSESLNLQLQKLGFCGRKELKPLRAAGKEKKIKPVKSSAFPGSYRTSGLFKVEGGMELRVEGTGCWVPKEPYSRLGCWVLLSLGGVKQL